LKKNLKTASMKTPFYVGQTGNNHRPMPRLVVATTNRGKLKEIAQLLAGAPVELLTLADFPAIAAPEETGRTFAANARLKALYYAHHTDELTVAEDSGLEIDALDGAPGIESARFGGADSTYPEKFALLYDALRLRKVSGSPARFVCALALASDGQVVFESRGTVEGQIAPEPRGTGGFGYDPIFYYPLFGCTLAEASAAQKAAVSHRGEAFRRLGAYLTTLNAEIAEKAE
jgi:XTP/dITP diphosphohydrolase